MAKSKRSRRPRREVVESQQAAAGPASADDAPASAVTTAVSSAPGAPESSARRKAVDFAENYLYVYTEMRNILVVAIVMFVVMIGLSFFI